MDFDKLKEEIYEKVFMFKETSSGERDIVISLSELYKILDAHENESSPCERSII